MAEETDDDNLAKKIEELAFTFRRNGLVANMDEALEKAKAIILGNTEDVPFMGGHDPAVEELFNKEKLPEQGHESNHDTHYAEPSNLAAPSKSYVLEQAPDKVENTCSIPSSQADDAEPQPVAVIETGEKPTPLEELEPETRDLLIEMDHEIVEEKVHHPPLITNAPVDESNIMRDFHLLDTYFEEDESKDINR
jgi:hypothetical protein